MSILALPWARQVNNFRDRFPQRVCDGSVADVSVGSADEVAIGGEGVAARDKIRDGVPKGDAEEAGEGHRDGDGDDLAELLREWCRDALIGEHRPAMQSSSFNSEKDGDGERFGW